MGFRKYHHRKEQHRFTLEPIYFGTLSSTQDVSTVGKTRVVRPLVWRGSDSQRAGSLAHCVALPAEPALGTGAIVTSDMNLL